MPLQTAVSMHRLEIPPRLGFYEAEKEVDENTLAALEVFEGLGATVEEVDINWTADI